MRRTTHLTAQPSSSPNTLHPLLRLALVLSIIALAHFPWLSFPWRIPTVGLIGLLLIHWETRAFSAAGIRLQCVRRSLIWIAVVTVIIIGFVTPVLQPLIDQLTGTKTDYSSYGVLRGNIEASIRLVGLAWLSAALGEELVFRCFLMHHLEQIFSKFRGRQITSSIFGGAIFGLMHAAQGIGGVLLTGIVGVIFCFAYLRSDRNAWALIVAHGLIDTWGIFTLYKGWY